MYIPYYSFFVVLNFCVLHQRVEGRRLWLEQWSMLGRATESLPGATTTCGPSLPLHTTGSGSASHSLTLWTRFGSWASSKVSNTLVDSLDTLWIMCLKQGEQYTRWLPGHVLDHGPQAGWAMHSLTPWTRFGSWASSRVINNNRILSLCVYKAHFIWNCIFLMIFTCDNFWCSYLIAFSFWYSHTFYCLSIYCY